MGDFFNSKTEQKTQTTSSVSAVDKRVGVAGDNNVTASDGASLTVVQNDLSADALDGLIRANAFVSDSAISAAAESARVAASAAVTATLNALDATGEANRLAISGVITGQDRSLDTVDRSLSMASNAAQDTIDAARAIAADNNRLTETTREGNQELVKLVADKLSTTVSDERQNINTQLLDTAFKYGAAALGAVALGLGFLLYVRRKPAA